MNLNEILKANGVGDEAITAIAAAMKENKIYTASEENLDIRYGKLKTQHDGVNQQLTEANALIEKLKKSNKGNDGLQQKVSEYETKVQQLQTELEQTKIDAEIKVALLANKAVDVDYLTFKLKNKGEALTLDENGKITGMDDKIAALKTQFPAQFESTGKKTVIENRLPQQQENEPSAPTSLEEALKMAYDKNE